MYRGRYMLGDHLPLGVLTVDGSQTPVAPTAAPTLDIYSSSAKVIANKSLPCIDRYGVTGVFGMRLFLDARYATGLYCVVYRWTTGSYKGLEIDDFEIIAGGDPDGVPIATHLYHRPDSDFIVQQLDSGRIIKGRNPTI